MKYITNCLSLKSSVYLLLAFYIPAQLYSVEAAANVHDKQFMGMLVHNVALDLSALPHNSPFPASRSNSIKDVACAGGGTSPVVNTRAYGDTINSNTVISGELKKWHKVTITFDGPFVRENGSPNPFLNYRLDVVFTHTSGKSYKVPGYFAADGNAGETSAISGKKWRVHFSPDETGTWTYVVYFREGPNISVSDDANEGTAVAPLDGQTGSFTILRSDKTGKDLRAKGRLKYVGESLLKFTETGEYFRKAGADAPENFLAYQDFDNTPNRGGRRKTWAPHVQDWNPGDVTWKEGKGKGIIGAVNYLSNAGMNVFSFLTMNINGDDKNVYPYINDSEFTRIDVSKVDQWEMVMEHAQKKGMYLHFKMQERENNSLLDGGDLGIERKLYCRELIARFSHHLALNWNIGEENSQTDKQRKAMAEYIHDHDPYKSNIVIHTFPGEQDEVYRPLLGEASYFTGISIQTNTDNVYSKTRQWVEASARAGKKWIVANDEQNPSSSGVAADAEYTPSNRGVVADNSETIRKDVLWGNLMAGGAGVEYYFGSNTGQTDLTCQDYRSRAKSWKYARYALEFFHTYLPTTVLTPFINLSSGSALNKDDKVYVVYLKEGGTSKISLPLGNYLVKWYDPRNGGRLQNGSVTDIGSGRVGIGSPPSDPTSDWVVLISNISSLGTTYQAEDYSAQSGTTIDSAHTGYTGAGYANYSGTGSWIEWGNVKSNPRNVSLIFYYSNGTDVNRQSWITINGTIAGSVNFIPTGSWNRWQTSVINVSLDSGANIIRVTAGTIQGGPNLDKMQVHSEISASRATFISPEEKRQSQDFSVYPNPASGIVNIVSANVDQSVIKVYNGQGVKVYSNKFVKQTQVNLSRFGSGDYYIQLEQNANKFIRKIILLK